MKNINYKTFRRAIFSAYALIAAFFCMALIYLGEKEISRSRSYAENEKTYVEMLLSYRNSINVTEKSFHALSADRAPEKALDLNEKALALKNKLGPLSDYDSRRRPADTQLFTELEESISLLISASRALSEDIKSAGASRDIEALEDMDEIAKCIESIGEGTQKLMKKDLDRVEIWQRQSFYFFSRMQYLLIIFFVLTTVFSVIASFLFSKALKSSLKKLSDGTREIRDGKFNYRFDSIQNDEIGQVMLDFNTMASQIEQQSENILNANRELQEAQKQKDSFLSNMSHELRTPLNSIIGFSELIAERAETLSPEKNRGYAKRILSSAEHLLELISNLLEITKLDAGMLKASFSEFDLGPCVNEAVEMLRPMAELKNLNLKAEILSPMPVCGDRQLLRQVFVNLLDNAVKFTAGGNITVSTSACGGEYRIDVADTGIGISDENQKAVFKDFQRAETGLTSNYKGTGIGLTLSKRLVEMHKGRIIVSGKLNEGSVFSVFIPVIIKERI